MQSQTVRLSVPAEPAYARSVRMMASNLAVVAGMTVDDVEDVRMAAEEGFVYACATEPSSCDVEFTVGEGLMGMDFTLGARSAEAAADEDVDAFEYATLILSAVCDDFHLTDDGSQLVLTKSAGVAADA